MNAFKHLPHLRDRIIPADKSRMRATPAMLALWDKMASDAGRPANWRWSDEQLEASRRATLGELGPDSDLWILAYGSLMWDPGCHFAEVRRAVVEGYSRRFSYGDTAGRGTPENPALMLALEPDSGCCEGLVFRIASNLVSQESSVVWCREMLFGGYNPKMLPVSTPQGELRALAFVANSNHMDYVGELDIEACASMIAKATGAMGTNRQYLDQLVNQLEKLGIHDTYVQMLDLEVKRAVLALG